jgi:IMP dehydrogenase
MSPMRTVSGPEMCEALSQHKILSFLPRPYDNFEDILSIYSKFENKKYIGVSIGATRDYLKHFQEYRMEGAEIFCIDVANGAHTQIEHAIKSIQDDASYSDRVKIITGNVASVETYMFLAQLKVHGIRIGIGSGSLCSTSIATGIGQGVISILDEIHEKKCELIADGVYLPCIIADGGIREPGDVVKSLAMGADAVMAGSIFAGTFEAQGDVIKHQGVYYKMYAGEASKMVRRNDSYIEGDSTLVKLKGSVNDVVHTYEDGLRSAMSYMNFKTIKDFKSIKPENIVILSPNSRVERTPHLVTA